MARRIELRTAYGHPAERVIAALTDETFVRERIANIGGRKSELVSFTADGDTTTAVMRQGIDAEHLPGFVRRIAPDGVMIDRTETWTAGAAPRGTMKATVDGFAGSLSGTTALVDTAGGSEMTLDGEVSIGIPLIGGKIEGFIADQLDKLLHTEGRFTDQWLRSRQA